MRQRSRGMCFRSSLMALRTFSHRLELICVLDDLRSLLVEITKAGLNTRFINPQHAREVREHVLEHYRISVGRVDDLLDLLARRARDAMGEDRVDIASPARAGFVVDLFAEIVRG